MANSLLVTSTFLRAARVLVPPGWKRRKCSILCFLPSCFTTNGVVAIVECMSSVSDLTTTVLTHPWSSVCACPPKIQVVPGNKLVRQEWLGDKLKKKKTQNAKTQRNSTALDSAFKRHGTGSATKTIYDDGDEEPRNSDEDRSTSVRTTVTHRTRDTSK